MRLKLYALLLFALGTTLAAACPPWFGEEDAGPSPDPVFDDISDYGEVRDCRHSHEHELRHIRVVADALALEVYDIWDRPYPVGSTIVKMEYDDEECANLIGYTAMKKLEEGENPDGHDWWWQKLDPAKRVLEEGAPVDCIDCHEHHCEPPNGFDLTCAEEL